MEWPQERVEPTRIRSARLAAGLKSNEAAVRVGVAPAHFSKIERGELDGDSYLTGLVRAFGLPDRFFYGKPLDIPDPEDLSYRRLMRMTSEEKLKVQGKSAILGTLASNLIERYVQTPYPDFPTVSGINPEQAAFDFRRTYDLGEAPLRNCVELVEALGIYVFWIKAPRDFSGVSFWIGNRPIILLNSTEADGYRDRFTLMHELGHILMHRDVDAKADDKEDEANQFASALLMPPAAFARWMRPYFHVVGLLSERKVWGCSVATMVRRARDLKVLSEQQYRDAQINMGRRGWRTGEPDPMKTENSRIHRFFLDEAGERGLTSFDLAEESGFGTLEFMAAFPIANEYTGGIKLDFSAFDPF